MVLAARALSSRFAARDEIPAAFGAPSAAAALGTPFGRRCIPAPPHRAEQRAAGTPAADCVAPPSNIPDIAPHRAQDARWGPHPRRRAAVAAAAGLLVAIWAAGCGPTVDLAKGLQVEVVSTGWFDMGIVKGQNKLVPSVSFRLKNVSDQTLSTLQVNALFRRVTEQDEWGSAFVTAAGSSGLPPGATTETLTVRSQLGYTGADQSRQDMLKNSHFVDAKVELFVKYSSAQWVRIGAYPIARELITK
jgi:hypothetical protein